MVPPALASVVLLLSIEPLVTCYISMVSLVQNLRMVSVMGALENAEPGGPSGEEI